MATSGGPTCVVCFEIFSKGSGKRNILKVASPYTLNKVFSRRVPNGFICDNCMIRLRTCTLRKHKNSMKRTWPSHTPQKRSIDLCQSVTPEKSNKRLDDKATPQKIVIETKFQFNPVTEVSCSQTSPKASSEPKAEGNSFIDLAVFYMKHSLYEKCFRLLIKKSKPAKDALLSVFSSIVKDEFKCVVKGGSLSTMMGPVSEPSHINSFNWLEVVEEIGNEMPVFSSIMNASLPSAETLRHSAVKGSMAHKR
jgi:hypothetical protein